MTRGLTGSTAARQSPNGSGLLPLSLPGNLGRPVLSGSRPTFASLPLGVQFAAAGVFTANWDHLGIDIGGRTLKFSHAALVFAFVLALHRRSVPSSLSIDSRLQLVRRVACILLVLYVFRSVILDRVVSGLVASLALAIPMAGMFALLRWRDYGRVFLNAYIGGLTIASLAAVLEFFVRLYGFRWVTDYNAYSLGVPRAAGFAIEAAYFAAPGFTALLLAVMCLDPGRFRTTAVLLISGGLVAANARIVLVQIAVLALLALRALVLGRFVLGPSRYFVKRNLPLMALIVMIVLIVFPGISGILADRAASVLDPDHAASNAPRIRSAAEVLGVVEEEIILGVGPGQLGVAIDGRTATRDAEKVANNVVLQLAVDVGAFGVILLLVMSNAVWRMGSRSERGPTMRIATCWFLLIWVAGAVTSNFSDSEHWLLLGLSGGMFESEERSLGSVSRASGNSRHLANGGAGS